MTDNDRPDRGAAVYYRNARLVAAVFDFLEVDDPVAWRTAVECIAIHLPRIKPKTVENVLYDMIAFGAVHRLGKYDQRRSDTRTVHLTPLGQAWFDRELLPWLNDNDPTEDH